MINKLDENLPASLAEDEKIQDDSAENPAASEPENTEKPLSGFQWYITHPASREEIIQRMKDFPKRREAFIASIRKSKD